MDTAKVVLAYLSTGVSDIKDLLKYKRKYNNKKESIFVPTTHGTGSEVTKWGTVWDPINIKKYSISHNNLYPSIAILDPSFTLTLPLPISLIVSMDALSHSFESIWNKNRNEESSYYAVKAIGLIISNLGKLSSNPLNIAIRKKL